MATVLPEKGSAHRIESLTDMIHSKPAQSVLTHGLLLVNVVVFVAMLGWGASVWHTSTAVPLAWGANFGPATQDGQWWRLFTAMFIHFGLWHLVMNMWALRDVGRLVERLYGPWRFAAIYVVGGVLGNLLSLVVQGNRAVSGGASGAIFGLYGALMVFLWRERRQVDPWEFRWLFGSASVFTVLMLGMGWVIPGIDNSAHGGGLVAGALMARVLAKPWTPRSPLGRFGQWAAVAALVSGAGWLAGHIPPPRYLLHDELRAQAAIQRFTVADQRISQQWGNILNAAPAQGLTFDQLAGQIESTVTAGYERTFEQLMAATPGTQAPSAPALVALQAYASQRAQVSRDLAQGLRTNDPQKIRDALRQVQGRPGAASKTRPASATASATR